MKQRLVAILIHLLISGFIACLAMALVFWAWYPSPLDIALGVSSIFLLMLSIDIVMGPILTGIVYKPNKPSLKLDLTVIGFLQIAALCYGLHTVYLGRPEFVVFNSDRFDVVRSLDLEPNSLKQAITDKNQNAIPRLFSPHWVAAVISPSELKRIEQITLSALNGGPDLPQLPDLYVPLHQVKEDIIKKAKPLSELPNFNSSHPELSGLHLDSVRYLPLRSKVRNMIVLIDPKTADIIKIADIDPWG